MKRFLFASSISVLCAAAVAAQPRRDPDWSRLEQETLQHFQAVLRLDTSNPPGNETRVVDYLAGVLTREGIPFQTFALDPNRANLVARLKGNGRKRPVLIMGHTDVVSVDPAKWTFPPFSATRDSGYIYGRGSLDDKPDVVAALMVLLEIKRLGVALDRDVIFLAEPGEEGTTRVGIDFMADQHLAEIDAEYCLAEGGGGSRVNGKIQFAEVDTTEKVARTVELVSRGPAGHGSVPTASNAVARLATAVAAVTAWQPPIHLNETTRAYFDRLASISSREDAARFRTLLGRDPNRINEVARYLRDHTPYQAALLRTTATPTMLRGGIRFNVIPSEAAATFDVRMLPDENEADVLTAIRKVVNDPAIEVRVAARDGKPRPPGISKIDSEAFRAIESAVAQNYDTVTIPAMSTGATDKAQLRAKGLQCYGIGPATDDEDAEKGFGAHSDQERILESDLHRYVRFVWDVVMNLARAK